MTKKISIKDIAKELDLSITTVSFVINGKGEEMGISEATINKVMELIKKRDYTPNNAARLLRTGKSNTIGLIVEDLGNYFFGNVAKVIELEASKRGYNVFLSSTDNSTKTAKELIRKMRNSSVDGLIITPTKGLRDELEKLRADHVPYVLFDRQIPEVDTNYVVLNNHQGAYDLTRHLISNGYEDIGFVTIVSEMSQMEERERGYRDAMLAAGLGVDKSQILKVRFDDPYDDVVAAIAGFVKKRKGLDALFFATNYLGVFGIEAMKKVKIKIPYDMAVVSFDDNDLFRLFTPSITVAAQPIREIAVAAIDLLLSVIKTGNAEKQTTGTIVSPVLIQRESSPPKL
jgi:LacI family transcriptional regulator